MLRGYLGCFLCLLCSGGLAYEQGALWNEVQEVLAVTKPYLPGDEAEWETAREKTTARVARATSEEGEVAAIREFFEALNLSHFNLSPREAFDEETLAQAPKDPTAASGKSEPLGYLPSLPTELRIETLSPEVLYLRFNVFTPNLMPDLRAAILEAADPDTLIIFDLRDNPGGLALMANGLAGLLTDEPFSLGTMTLPDATLHQRVFPQPGAHPGPVAVFINQNTASTGEILAAGLQESNRARIFGTPSAGAVLPSFLRGIGEQGAYILQYPVADFVTPEGHRLEGRGVQPDETLDHPLAEDLAKDPLVRAAITWKNTLSTE